jgi:ligand-binding SRPBCC domain-containing protein
MKKEFKKADSKGRESLWEWEETPEVTAALAKYWQTVAENKNSTAIKIAVADRKLTKAIVDRVEKK